MLTVKYADRAEQDITSIANYTRRNFGRGKAKKYTAAITVKVQQLASGTLVGRKREDLEDGNLLLPVGKHFIIFRKESDVLIVARVLHQQMDISRHRLH